MFPVMKRDTAVQSTNAFNVEGCKGPPIKHEISKVGRHETTTTTTTVGNATGNGTRTHTERETLRSCFRQLA